MTIINNFNFLQWPTAHLAQWRGALAAAWTIYHEAFVWAEALLMVTSAPDPPLSPPLIGQNRSRDLNTGLWLANAATLPCYQWSTDIITSQRTNSDLRSWECRMRNHSFSAKISLDTYYVSFCFANCKICISITVTILFLILVFCLVSLLNLT